MVAPPKTAVKTAVVPTLAEQRTGEGETATPPKTAVVPVAQTPSEPQGASNGAAERQSRAVGRVVTGQELRIEAVRQWSALLAELVSGWGGLGGGIVGLVFPHIVPALIAAHPIQFCIAGVGVLAGKKLAALAKAALGAM